ncbi:MAG: Transcription antitermination protein NusB [Chlamydiia bacterium]|nr:Transcription antitermination protein NusB [Chlamydiia bacterium]
MELSPIKQREISIQLLYLLNDGGNVDENSASSFMSVFGLSKKKIMEISRKVQIIFDQKDILDSHIEKTSQEYALERVSKVDLATLRCLIYELINNDLPVEIAISEALRIAKKFSNYGSGKYLHAMIDSIYKGLQHEQKITH